MNDEGIEWAIRELLKQRELAEAAYSLNRRTFVEFADRLDALTRRVSALEATRPAPLTYPTIEPERLNAAQAAAERVGMEPFTYSERS